MPHEPAGDAAFAVLVAGALFLTAMALVVFGGIASMFLLSALVAYALLPVVDRVAGDVPRSVAVLLVAFGLVGALALGVASISMSLTGELGGIGESLAGMPALVGKGWRWLDERLPAWVSRPLDQALASLGSSVRGAALRNAALDWATRIGSGVVTFASAVIFMPVFVFVMLRGFHGVVTRVGRLVPPRWRPTVRHRAIELDRAVSGFVRGQLLVALIVGVLYAIGLSIIGVPLAVAVGIIAGIAELVPYLGGAIALTLGVLLALSGGEPLDALWVVAVFAAVQLFEGGLLSPWIVGNRAALSPATVIIALAVAGHFFGITGLILGVPAAAALKLALSAATSAYEHSPLYLRPRRRMV